MEQIQRFEVSMITRCVVDQILIRQCRCLWSSGQRSDGECPSVSAIDLACACRVGVVDRSNACLDRAPHSLVVARRSTPESSRKSETGGLENKDVMPLNILNRFACLLANACVLCYHHYNYPPFPPQHLVRGDVPSTLPSDISKRHRRGAIESRGRPSLHTATARYHSRKVEGGRAHGRHFPGTVASNQPRHGRGPNSRLRHLARHGTL